MNSYCVYKHTAPSGRVYIGISCNPEKRWNNGKGYKYNPYFWRCIKKYGWENIKHEILFDKLTLEKAKQLEIELIEESKSNIREYGYNISGGGDGLVAEESRLKMSIARKGKNYCIGRNVSDSTKEKISASLKEYFLNHEPNFIGKHHNPATIERLKNRVVSDEAKEKMKQNHADMSGAKNPSAKKVLRFSLDGIFEKTYDYAKQAAIELGVDLSSIIKCCRGKQKSCGGYIWKYVEPVYGWEEQP